MCYIVFESIMKKLNRKRIYLFFLPWLIALPIGLVIKSLQNDTFYTIKIGEWIIRHGIDMMDHFSFHSGLVYTYPHWLYDCFIYLVYNQAGFMGIYISTIFLMIVLILLVFSINIKLNRLYISSFFSTIMCMLIMGIFATARAQLVSYILFILELYLIESFLKKSKKRYALGLLLISLLLCNIHVAVWPFYFILFLPYFAEYIISSCFIKKNYKFINKHFIFEKNCNIKYLFLIFILSIITGLLTPLGTTPYTYLIKTIAGNSQSYIQEHQMITWINSPFTIVIISLSIFLGLYNKIHLRDFFTISGITIMTVFSIRHMALLGLIGVFCFARTFSIFINDYASNLEEGFLNIICKTPVIIISSIFAISLSAVLFIHHNKKDFIDKKFYPIEATEYIKENLDLSTTRIFNDYNFGSYLILNDIPVFIDSRADLYTKQFSGFDYDIFDDYHFISLKYQDVFQFYNITHILIYNTDNNLVNILKNNSNFRIIYQDEYFSLYKRIIDKKIEKE